MLAKILLTATGVKPPPTWTLTINSAGVTGVPIDVGYYTSQTYAGTTNYTRTKIPDGTSITLIAPQTVAPNYEFDGWSHLAYYNKTTRSFAVSMNSDYSTTAIYTKVTTSYSGVVVAASCRDEPHIYVYPWSDSTGFGLRFAAPTNYPDPGGANYMPVKFNPSRTAIFLGEGEGDYLADIHAYPWTSSGFGTKYANPARISGLGSITGMDVNSAGNCIAVSCTGKGIVVYPWNNSTGFGTPFIRPSVGTWEGYKVAFSPSGAAVVAVSKTSPFIHGYRWNPSTGFGQKYTDPSTLPSTPSFYGLSFSPTGKAVAVSDSSSGKVSIYAWTDTGGFGTRYSDPSTLPGSTKSVSVQFNKAGNVVALSTNSPPYLHAYVWNDTTGFGSKFSNPSVAYSSLINDISFSPTDLAILTTCVSSPYIQAIAWNNTTGFGTRHSNPVSNPTSRGLSVTVK